MMMLGREVFHPIDLVTGTCIISQKIKEPCQFVIDLKDTLENVHTSNYKVRSFAKRRI